MGTGVFLAVLGAILTFAVRDEMPNVDLTVVGLILMIAGGVIIWHARQGSIRERVITEVDGVDETASPRTVRKVIRDRDVE